MEAPTPTPAAAHGDPAGRKKRPLEPGRPGFVAREDGAYHVLEMPKKHRCGGYDVAANPRRRRARSHFLTDGGGTVGTEKQSKKKRELELDAPEFVAEEESGGAYQILDMPKKYKCEYMADPERSGSPRTNALDAEEARSLAMLFRTLSVTGKYIQELKAMAAARRNSNSSADSDHAWISS